MSKGGEYKGQNFLDQLRRKGKSRRSWNGTSEELQQRFDRYNRPSDQEEAPTTLGEKLAQKWRDLPRGAKIGIPAGGTVLAVGATGIGLANTEHEETVSPQSLHEGKFDYDGGETALTDASGKPALLNYFTPGQDRVLEVSLASTVPDAFREGRTANHLRTVENSARSHTTYVIMVPVTTCSSDGNGGTSCSTTMVPQTHVDYHYYNYPLEIEKDFKPATQEQETRVRAFFEEFTSATGIPVRITYDNPDAHITVANYRNAPDSYRGSLDYVNPGSLNSVPPGATGSGPGLKQGFLILNDRNSGQEKGLKDQIAKTLGFESGKANWLGLRQQLRDAGLAVPEVNPGPDTYDLSQDLPKHALFPKQTIVDSGGENTLQGSEKNDTLLTEAGYCGRIDTPRNKLSNIFGDGKAYCVAEGEFAIVKAGAGDDFIIASRAGYQSIEPGPGNDRIAFFQPEIGDKVILAGEGNNDLLLNDDLVNRGGLVAEADGQDVVLRFSAPSGRDLGSIRLVDQLEPGKGIDNITVVDGQGVTIFSQGVKDLTAESWEKDAVEPLVRHVEKNAQSTAQNEAARLGGRNRWAASALAGRSQDNGVSL